MSFASHLAGRIVSQSCPEKAQLLFRFHLYTAAQADGVRTLSHDAARESRSQPPYDLAYMKGTARQIGGLPRSQSTLVNASRAPLPSSRAANNKLP